ncbi:Undecaprenyl phosphate N,N'-diacetylbacillosamine 1-phosphate transferase [Photobacterium malacitanum]|uniref:Undecaprenyl phosphate N,N'-diacetylbacillosamine 1-phosphate transferase n=1 Tax=Photobacterium malacitanum TaxID=2204294 RepID=A0A1Y6MGD1_9GAMM|nr:undecaprenyl-phosphate galactose phosphotransferase WbaP [Photobacterium malacitanum]SMY35623.1 Undecaprenyl phosphate N,N'-diacetylbacillosamine 1-phosphate transferase [Photobacterium malacitanum]
MNSIISTSFEDDFNIGNELKKKNFINKYCLLSSDIISLTVSYFIILVFVNESNDYLYYRTLNLILIFSFIILLFLSKSKHYTYRKPFWNELREILNLIVIAALVDFTATGLLGWNISFEEWIYLWCSISLLIPVSRFFTKKILVSLSLWFMPSIIIGSGKNAKDAYRAINSENLMGFDVRNFVTIDDCHITSEILGVKVINYNDALERLLGGYKVFIALEYEQRDLRDLIIRRLTSTGVRNISVIPSMRGVPLYSTDISHFFSHEVMMLRINNNLARKTSKFIKRFFDIIISSLFLFVLSPLFVYISYQVRKDGGSATYGHERVGQNGKKFKCLKFRSMVINSQEILQHLLDNDKDARDEWEKDFKLKNDPRITAIGKFLRRSSLDELPQLWNVLKGEMSLVGPRPIIEQELLRYKDDADYYLMAKPGMSGLWQVSGRNDINYETRVYLDSWYVKNWSLWYDIAILFKTVNVVLKRDGAY